MTGTFRVEPLQDQDRKSFTCEVPALDRYLREQATQDARRRVSNCFIALDPAGGIAAFYTFAATSLPLSELPADETRRLPRYGLIPAALIGRLAVDVRYRRQRLGSALIFDAVQRAARADPAIFALVVDAKDEAAANFYLHQGFQRFNSRPLTLYLPMATALKALVEPSAAR